MKISGKVTDKSTGDPIPYVNVYFAKNKQGVIGPQRVGTTTNDFGRYKLDWPADTWITASATGYKMVTKPLPYQYDTDQELNFEMEPSVSELSAIEITAKPVNSRTKFIIAGSILTAIIILWFLAKRRVVA